MISNNMRGTNPLQKFKNLGVVTAGWGSKTAEESFHPGIDVANAAGTPIPAMAGGTVTQVDGGHAQGENNFGNTLAITDAAGNTHQYHHLQTIGVKPGQVVQPGEAVATMGNTGATYSPSGKGDGTHLDYRIVSAYGQYKNPLTYLRNF